TRPHLVRDEKPRRALDAILAGEELVLEGRGVGDGSVQGADDAHGTVEILERLLLDDRGEALADAAGARVLVRDEHLAAVPPDGQERVAVERGEAAEVEHGRLDAVLREAVGDAQ